MKIGGMTCAMCVGMVEKTLGQLPGVESVTVNLGSKQTYGKNRKNGVRFTEFVKFKRVVANGLLVVLPSYDSISAFLTH